MKQETKGRLQGVVAGILIGTAITGSVAFARANINVIVDGKDAVMTDAEGNFVQAFEENGVAYIPLRGVSQILGKAVSWDGPTQTAYIGHMDGTLPGAYVDLKDLTDIGSEQGRFESSKTDNYGNKYVSSLAYEGWISTHNYCDEYLLNGKYSKLRGTLYVKEGVSADTESHIKIIADDTVLQEYQVDKTSKPINFDFDIKGYNDIKFEVETGSNYFSCSLGDVKLYQ